MLVMIRISSMQRVDIQCAEYLSFLLKRSFHLVVQCAPIAPLQQQIQHLVRTFKLTHSEYDRNLDISRRAHHQSQTLDKQILDEGRIRITTMTEKSQTFFGEKGSDVDRSPCSWKFFLFQFSTSFLSLWLWFQFHWGARFIIATSSSISFDQGHRLVVNDLPTLICLIHYILSVVVCCHFWIRRQRHNQIKRNSTKQRLDAVKNYLCKMLQQCRGFAAETVACAIWLAWFDSCCASDANITKFIYKLVAIKFGESRTYCVLMKQKNNSNICRRLNERFVPNGHAKEFSE